jgi:formylglycine-generating enzyme required for sulfatase activity
MKRAALIVATSCASAASRAIAPGMAPAPVAPHEPAVIAETPTAAPAALDCADDMVAIEAFCIDKYEAPNVRGELPFAFVTAYDGEDWCAEHGKRLCTEDEWVRACGGTQGRPFPYGDEHRKAACNDDRLWITVLWRALARWPDGAAVEEATRLYQADMSGARAECVSEEGVYDLTGNVAEWVRRSGPPARLGYEHVLKGCYWAGCYHEPEPNCAFANHAHPGAFRTYEAGFRCCADRRMP